MFRYLRLNLDTNYKTDLVEIELVKAHNSHIFDLLPLFQKRLMEVKYFLIGLVRQRIVEEAVRQRVHKANRAAAKQIPNKENKN